jgi:hypothetical protein
MTRRIKIIIVVGGLLAFTIWKVDLADRLGLSYPPASEPNAPVKVEFYQR